ncbi:hypothetical protein KSP40_PGU021697 [Platanthera guangdongensis]|uniref:Uncharacterized protein n=1 Tax=Platanthera guangdongensis TaxID=2320717 RepID=A0ABR2MYM1_9ASPA
MPDGVLFNGLGPFLYNESIVPGGIVQETINAESDHLSFFLCSPCKTCQLYRQKILAYCY